MFHLFLNEWTKVFSRHTNYEKVNRCQVKIAERLEYTMFSVILSIVVAILLLFRRRINKVAKISLHMKITAGTFFQICLVIVHCRIQKLTLNASNLVLWLTIPISYLIHSSWLSQISKPKSVIWYIQGAYLILVTTATTMVVYFFPAGVLFFPQRTR